ncbi:hypothetical protein AX16_001766 [Volvariella volvacea WC 439]|nr:hypothetical protein AX16_001766 [Volvariella volvacea WC 439]
MSGLIDTVRNKFLEAIRSVNPPGKWKILVVDDHSQRLLGSVLKQFDVLAENVTLIESITSYREPQQGFEAMYLLMPTTQNVDRIVKDFSGANRQYAAAHLFFIDGLSEALFQRLTSSPAEPYLQALKELFINFWALEAQAFSLRDPGLFFSIYSPPRDNSWRVARDRLEEDLRFASKIITNVCITLNEFPYIRYYMPNDHLPLGPLKPNEQTRPPPPPEQGARWRTNLARGAEARAYENVETDFVTKLLAFMVQNALEEHQRNNPDFATSKPGQTQRPRATLLITDRSMDMLAPFLHEFTYQAMANDLLPIEDGTKFTYKFQSSVGAYEDKTAVLNDSDNVWTEIRHMHMREAIDKLMADFNKFLQDNAVFQGQVRVEGAASLNDMKDMLASLPQYQEQREKFSLHLSMAQQCMEIFDRDKLPLVGNVEQCCATGVNAEGKTPKSLVEDMVLLLDNREVININKVRIVALYIQYRDGVPDEDRRRLFQHARLTLAEQDAVNALVHFGLRIGRGANDKDTKKKFKQRPSGEEEYELSRYKPALRLVLEDQASSKLDNTLFPYVKDSPSTLPPATLRTQALSPATSLRSQKPAWHKAAKTQAAVDVRERLIVFVAGGVTYSEVREAYQLSTSLNKEIIIGSTHNITPRQFVDDLKVLDLGGVGSKAMPNGLREPQGRRDPQAYYDEKYFTKDAPPPARPQPSTLNVPKDSRKPIPVSPTNSYQGSISSGEPPYRESEKKEKKRRGLFRF